MKRNVRILSNTLATIVLLVIFLPLYLSLLLNIPFVQNIAVKYLSQVASEYIQNEVSIKKVDIGLFYRASVDGFFVEDPTEGDTLIYVDKVKARLANLRLKEGINLDYAELDGANFYLNTDTTDTILNLKVLVNKMRPKKPKNKKPFILNIDEIEINNLNFEFRKREVMDVETGVDYKDMRFNGVRLSARDFSLVKDSFDMSIDSLYLTEKSGLNVTNVAVDRFTASPSEIKFSNGLIGFENSQIDVESYSMRYSMWNMSDFVNKVKLDVKIREAFVDFRDISRFTPRKLPLRLQTTFKGEASGVISDFDVKLRDFSSYLTEIEEIDATIKGIPDIPNTNFDVKIKNLTSSAQDLEKVSFDMTGKDFPVIRRLLALSNITFNGEFKGLLKNFYSNGYLNTNLGSLSFDISNTPVAEGLKILGDVDIKDFNAGVLLNTKKLGKVSMVGDVDALVGREDVSVETNALISSLNYNSYNYNGLNIDGKIVNKTFFGYVGCSDPNIDFKFNGALDLDTEIPKYDFNLDIKRANLAALNFTKKDSISVLSGLLVANGSGLDIDNINGDIRFDSFEYINSLDTVNIDKVTFVTRNTKDSKFMRLNSEYIDAELQGKQSYSNIFKYLIKTVRTYLPSITDNVASSKTKIKKGTSIINNSLTDTTNLQQAQNGYYIANIDVKKANNIASIFMPGLEVSEDTNMSFLFNPAKNEFTFNFDSKSIVHKNTKISDINISSISSKDSISLYARSKEMMFNNVYIPNFLLLGGIKNNSVNLDSRFFNDNDKSEALISTRSIFGRDEETGALKINVSVLPSRFSLGKDSWSASSGTISIENSAVKISKFLIAANDKSFSVWGDISKNESDTLHLKINNFDLSPLTEFTDTLGFKVAGRMDGDFKVGSVLSNPKMITKVDFRGVSLNDKVFKDAVFTSDWSDKKQHTIFMLKQDGNSPLINGAFRMKEKLVMADVNIKDVDISLFSPFTRTMFSELGGTADINVRVSNPNRKLRIDGKVGINDFSTSVLFTNVRYDASGYVKIENNHYKLHDGRIHDEYGSECDLNAELWADGYKNVGYTISATPQKMMFMNTTLKDNETFYGKIFGSGNVSIAGKGTNVVMDVYARSESNSTFFMPLSSKTSITKADYIKFAKRDTLPEDVKLSLINRKKTVKKKNKGSFQVNLDMNIQPNLEAQIVIDPTVGDIIKGRGMGDLKMSVNPSIGLLTLNGGVEIINGNYLFTLSNIINKYFEIQPGSTISWTGDPIDANLNITATYQVKTSLAPLLGNDSQFSKRVEVDCDLSLAGRMLKPDINLGISLPDTDPEVQSYVNSVLNTEEAISTQIFWLLFANTFYADSNNASFSSAGLTTGAAVTGLEFLSNQISNWVSSDKFNVGFSYRPKGDMTSDELELRTYTPLIKNKLFLDVEGNLNFKNNTAYVTDNLKMFTVDASLTWILDSIANISTKLFTRPIDTFDENQGLQQVGLGLYYKYDFDKFNELIEQLRMFKIRRKEKKSQKKQDKSY